MSLLDKAREAKAQVQLPSSPVYKIYPPEANIRLSDDDIIKFRNCIYICENKEHEKFLDTNKEFYKDAIGLQKMSFVEYAKLTALPDPEPEPNSESPADNGQAIQS